MITDKKMSMVTLAIGALCFIAFAGYILSINQEVFYLAQEHSEFLPGTPYFNTLLSHPFGLMQYVGAWLTQFFYVPALGSAILALLWMLIFYVGMRAFCLKRSSAALMFLPVACLLTSVTDLGYWVYTNPIRGYWFSQSVGYLVMLTLLWIARCTPRKWHWAWYLTGFCLYPVLGWFALLFILCVALVERPSWRELIGVVFFFAAAPFWRSLLYSQLNFESFWYVPDGLPVFSTSSDETLHLSNPFWVLGGTTLLIALCGRYLNMWMIPVLSSVAGILFTFSLMFSDATYVKEMRMARFAAEDNWGEVLSIAEETPELTNSMIFLKNIALMNEGGLLDDSFRMGNIACPIYNPDSIRVSFLEIASPIAYYNYGLLNEAFRLSFECAVQSGFTPCYLKMLARCAYANGEEKLANRYITLLHAHPYYHDWQPAPVSDKIRELQNAYPDEITGVENTDGYLVNSVAQWYTSDSKLASEQALFYSMMRRDSKAFWASMRKFVKTHRDEEIPVHVIEAYILYTDKAPEEKRMIAPVAQSIFDRYNKFWEQLSILARTKKSRDELAPDMRSEFGDTYWYYNVFSKKVY